MRSVGGALGIQTATVRTINLMRVSGDLVGRGWQVYQALRPSCLVDVIAERDLSQLGIRIGRLPPRRADLPPRWRA